MTPEEFIKKIYPTLSESDKAEAKKMFPQLAESEDEKIRKKLIRLVQDAIDKTGTCYSEEEGKPLLAWLEKQKEQKPSTEETELNSIAFLEQLGYTCIPPEKHEYESFEDGNATGLRRKKQKPVEWSEEFLRLMNITISQDGNQVCVLMGDNLQEGLAGFGDTLADAVEDFSKAWQKYDRFRKATWKPSKEQMEAIYNILHPDDPYYDELESLYNDLKAL